jgi:hypothetical protein
MRSGQNSSLMDSWMKNLATGAITDGDVDRVRRESGHEFPRRGVAQRPWATSPVRHAVYFTRNAAARKSLLVGRPVPAAQPKPIAKHLTVERSAELEGAFEVFASLVVNAGRRFDTRRKYPGERGTLEHCPFDIGRGRLLLVVGSGSIYQVKRGAVVSDRAGGEARAEGGAADG